jgi:hypothetical protein
MVDRSAPWRNLETGYPIVKDSDPIRGRVSGDSLGPGGSTDNLDRRFLARRINRPYAEAPTDGRSDDDTREAIRTAMRRQRS